MTFFKKIVNFVNCVLDAAAQPGKTSCVDCVCQTPTINELKARGYKVRVTHIRNYIDKYFWNWVTTKELREMKENGQYNCNRLSQWGGATVVQLSKGNEELYGVAVCSELDNFNRKHGLSLAIERALS